MANVISKMVQIGYMYVSETNQKRSGALIIKAPTIADATNAARKQLSQEYDWFKITKAVVIDGDHQQQQL